MTLAERLATETKSAMLSRDAERLSTLRMLKSALGYAELEKQTGSLSDSEFVAVTRKEVKKRREAAEQFAKGGRPEQAAKESKETGGARRISSPADATGRTGATRP